MQQQDPPEDRPSRAVRLTFSFGPDGVRLIDRQVIQKRVPPTDDQPPMLDARTVTAEVRTAADAPVYRRVLPHALPVDVEVFDSDGTAHRDPTPPERGVFTVVVPDDPDATDVVLLRREPDRGLVLDTPQEGGRPVEYGRFPLRSDEPLGNV